MIDTIIFDCDGVVLDTGPAWVESSKIFLSKRGIEYKPENIRHLLTGKTLLDSTKVMKDFYHLEGTAKELTKERFNIVKDTFHQGINFVPGFISFLNIISKNYKFSMATSINIELFKIADQRLELNKLFKDHVYFGELLNNASKPKPDIYLHAAENTNSMPSNCLVIEDAPLGIQSAKNAGMKCIGITTTFKAELLNEANVIVNSYEQINLEQF